MKRALWTNFQREVKRSWNRFLSIALISALGVAFYSGVRATGPDMVLTADAYYDSSNLMDIRILSTWGVTQEDINLFSEVDGVKHVEGAYSQNVYGKIDDSSYILKVMSMPETTNQVTMSEGRMPEKSNECVVDSRLQFHDEFQLGATIQVTAGDDTDIENTLACTSYTIVGFVDTAYYVSRTRESVSFGDGNQGGFIMVDPKNFKSEYFTEAYVSVEGALDKTSYREEYDTCVNTVLTQLKTLCKEREEFRYEVELETAQNTLNEEKENLDNSRETVLLGLENINDAKQTLEDKQTEIMSGWQSLEQAKLELQQNRVEGTSKLSTTYQQLVQSQQIYDNGVQQIAQYQSSIQQVQQQMNGIQQQMAMQLLDEPTGLIMLNQLQQQLEQIQAEFIPRQAELDYKGQILEEGWTAYNVSATTFQTTINQAESEIAANEQQLLRGQQEIQDATQLLNQQEESIVEAQDEIAEGEEAIALAEEQIEEIQKPTYYVLDRNSLMGYVELHQDSERIDAIGKIFPAIFFIVAALVCLTTMTRMVEADRNEIGTLKAIGYTGSQIAMKYILYALLATITGSIIGVFTGQKILPPAIIDAYSMMYKSLPKTLDPLNINYTLVSTLLAIITTTFATVMACHQAMASSPAVLMRPIAPKNGKQIFLEKIPLIWRKLTFTKKVTIRNLVRYKKRFFMTIFGIAGCMALLVVGFGLKDSIFSIVNDQYEKCLVYSASATLANCEDDSYKLEIDNYLNKNSNIEKYLYTYSISTDVKKNDIIKSAYLVVPEEPETINDYIHLTNRITQEEYELNDSEVIITEKLAGLLRVRIGDSFIIEDEINGNVQLKVGGIVENHIYHYIYMSPQLYQKLYGNKPTSNEILLQMNDNSDAALDKNARSLLEMDGVSSFSKKSNAKDKVTKMLDGMDFIIIVLIVSAGALAFVVLYNLNNINITERRRELATIKVLGFYDKEVAEYVYRENIILTLFGTLLGMGLGILMHYFVITTAELDMIMFGRKIFAQSFLYSFAITCIFALIINGILYFNLKKIDMIESLKSIE